MDRLIPLPGSLEGARFVEVTFTVGSPEPVRVYSWPLVGWENTGRRLPVVAETDGRLQPKQTSEQISQLTGGSATFFITRMVTSQLDVGPTVRELREALTREVGGLGQTPGQAAIDDVTLPEPV